jgi:replicative DNA helicase
VEKSKNIQDNLELTLIGYFMTSVDCEKDREIKIDALCQINEELFLNESNLNTIRIISKIILSGKDCNIETVYLGGAKDIINFDTIKYSPSSMTGIFQAIGNLKYQKYKRDLIKTLKTNLCLFENGSYYDDLEEIKNGLIADLSITSMDEKPKFVNIAEVTEKIKSQLNGKNTIEGYSWGISDVDEWTSGIVKPRLYVIGGLKKSGKSRFLIHTFKSLYEQNIKSAFISMEMPERDVIKLLHASMLGVNDLKFRAGSYLNKEEKIIFDNNKIDESLLGIECKGGLKIAQITDRIRRLAKMGFEVIGIDYIQRIKMETAKRADELEDISTAIADATRLNNVAVILMSQFNASAENPHEPPNMGSLKGSGGIGEAPDVVMLIDNLYRRTKKDADKNLMDIYFEQRYGDSGKLQIQTDLGCCAFRNLLKPGDVPNTKKYEPVQEEIF